MKKILSILSVMSILSLSSYACWFTESNFNTNYIASVNGSAVHYTPSGSISETVYINGLSVALPLTVQIKVSERFGDQEGDDSTRKPIKVAKLQYKIVRQNGTQTSFITVNTLDNPKWSMNFSVPVNLFGKKGIIDISDNDISSGDSIIIRLYLSDGLYYTGDPDSDIQLSEIPDVCSYNLNNIYIGTDGWSAPFVFRVIYNGKRRVMI